MATPNAQAQPATVQGANADAAATHGQGVSGQAANSAAFSQRDVLAGTLSVRRAFVGLPLSVADDAIVRAAAAIAHVTGQPAPPSADAAATFLGIYLLQDKTVAEETLATYADLARSAWTAGAPDVVSRKRPRDEELDLLAAAADLREDKGRVRYAHLAAHVRVPADPLTYQFLYPHLWVPKQGEAADPVADRWAAEAMSYVNTAMFTSDNLKSRCRRAFDEVRAWIRATPTTQVDNVEINRDRFRFGWNRFVEVGELYAVGLRRQTAHFHERVVERLNEKEKVPFGDACTQAGRLLHRLLYH